MSSYEYNVYYVIKNKKNAFTKYHVHLMQLQYYNTLNIVLKIVFNIMLNKK